MPIFFHRRLSAAFSGSRQPSAAIGVGFRRLKKKLEHTRNGEKKSCRTKQKMLARQLWPYPPPGLTARDFCAGFGDTFGPGFCAVFGAILEPKTRLFARFLMTLWNQKRGFLGDFGAIFGTKNAAFCAVFGDTLGPKTRLLCSFWQAWKAK